MYKKAITWNVKFIYPNSPGRKGNVATAILSHTVPIPKSAWMMERLNPNLCRFAFEFGGKG